MTDAATRAYWLDWDYDRDRASHGNSRYAIYLRDRHSSFQEIAEFGYDDPSVEFARIAWRIATGPILAPPLVRSHPRILSTELSASGWNGEMIAAVDLVAPRPGPLANARSADGDYYRDTYFSSWGVYEGVSEEDLTKAPYLLTIARLVWQLRPGTVPTIRQVPVSGDAIFHQAVDCLTALVAALNRQVLPVIETLESA